MAIVIGAGTLVSFGAACVISANWGYNPNVQRFYCLNGQWTPAFSQSKPTETLSLTVYAGQGYGGGGTMATTADTSCAVRDGDKNATVSPGICPSGSVAGPSSTRWYVTSYSYTKDDANIPGQESWSMQQWVTGVGVILPTYVIRGISEGTAVLPTPAKAGITFSPGTTSDSRSGNVSAGGLGKADNIRTGTVANVGAPSAVAGDVVNGSATIPYTPLYI
jgi:hypothetical protein